MTKTPLSTTEMAATSLLEINQHLSQSTENVTVVLHYCGDNVYVVAIWFYAIKRIISP